MKTPSAGALHRRDFLVSIMAAMAAPVSCLAAERNGPRRLKITNVDVLVTNPSQGQNQNFVLVKILTNEPEIYGWGDATCTGSELGVARFLEEHLKPGLLGQNPLRTENLWQTLYFLPYYRSGSVHMSALSGIDMALCFFEDPLRPEHLDTFRIIRNQTSTPIAMGKAFTGLWEGRELITEHLIDYLRHDLAHVGGVTAGRKLATLAEPYGILTAWHGPGNISPISHMANCHVSLSVPNFGIQEYAHGWGEPIREVFTAMPAYADGHVTIHDAPGLGLDVNEKGAKRYPYQRFLRPAIRRADDTPWPY